MFSNHILIYRVPPTSFPSQEESFSGDGLSVMVSLEQNGSTIKIKSDTQEGLDWYEQIITESSIYGEIATSTDVLERIVSSTYGPSFRSTARSLIDISTFKSESGKLKFSATIKA